jgi:two-component system OmpR family response regulator
MRVLIAEDDQQTLSFLDRSLGELGHEVVCAENGGDALKAASSEAFDVAVLDRMLPQIDGVDVLQQMRARGIYTPILMLTALGRIEDRVAGLDAGADDYLVKPFAIEELSARINAITRRRAIDEKLSSINIGPLTLDVVERELRFNGNIIPLQPREYRLLEQLMRNSGRTITRTMILESVWGFHFDPQTNLVETHMSRLRAKLALAGAANIIETVRKIGYRLRVDG